MPQTLNGSDTAIHDNTGRLQNFVINMAAITKFNAEKNEESTTAVNSKMMNELHLSLPR